MRAVIFDLDGVIVDSENFNFCLIRDILLAQGYELSPERYRQEFLGHRIKMALREFLGKEHHKAHKIALEFIEKKRETLRTSARENFPLREGIMECMKSLYKDFPLGLNTSTIKEFALRILREHNLSFYFSDITTGDEVRNPKPEPEGYLLTAQKLRMSPFNCVVIEDSELGVEAAIRAGMKCIAVPNEFTRQQNFSKATIILKGFKDINEALVMKL